MTWFQARNHLKRISKMSYTSDDAEEFEKALHAHMRVCTLECMLERMLARTLEHTCCGRHGEGMGCWMGHGLIAPGVAASGGLVHPAGQV